MERDGERELKRSRECETELERKRDNERGQ